MPKWERRPESRRDDLARAALDLCSERGVQATRVADIAERAGVTVGTVYRYFRDKEELIDSALRIGDRPPPPVVADRPGAVLPALAEAIRRWGAYYAGEGAQGLRVAFSDPQRDSIETSSAINEAISEFIDLIEGGVQRGEMRADLPPAALASLLVAALAGGSGLHQTGSDSAANADLLAAIATRGLRADGPSWRPSGS